MFQASRNWSGIAGLVPGMSKHLSYLPNLSGEKDPMGRAKLMNENGELVDNYDLIFRELFCVAASALAETTRESLLSAGLLWDQVLPTGAASISLAAATKDLKEARPYSTNLAEKGVRQFADASGGQGSLMFLVRRVNSDREVQKLEASGYRFAEIRQVSNIIKSSMQIQVNDLESKFDEMAVFSEARFTYEKGVHLGFFAIRTRQGEAGCDVVVRKGVRNLLPTAQLPINRLERWHMDVLETLDGESVAFILNRLESLKKLGGREMLFATQFCKTLNDLRSWVGDPIFDEAMLTAKPVDLPYANEEMAGPVINNYLIAFRLVLPPDTAILSPRCELTPLEFFRVDQLCCRSSPHKAAFPRAVHRELVPIISSVPSVQQQGASQTSRKQRSSWLPRWATQFGKDQSRGLSTKMGRLDRAKRVPPPMPDSFDTGSTLKLCDGRRSSERGREDRPARMSQTPDSAPGSGAEQPRSEAKFFGGIMVSQEVSVGVVDVDVDDASTMRVYGPKTGPAERGRSRLRKKGLGGFGSEEQVPALCDVASINSDAFEGQPFGGKASSGGSYMLTGGTSNAGVESSERPRTFVDELWELCTDDV